MSSPAGLLLLITLFVLIAIVVIVVAALVQRPTSAWREQWKRNTDDVRSVGVRHMIGEPVQPRLVRFEELWVTESEPGSAYVAAPKIPSREVVSERLRLHPTDAQVAPESGVSYPPAPPASTGPVARKRWADRMSSRAVPVPSDPEKWVEPTDDEEELPEVEETSFFARRWEQARAWYEGLMDEAPVDHAHVPWQPDPDNVEVDYDLTLSDPDYVPPVGDEADTGPGSPVDILDQRGSDVDLKAVWTSAVDGVKNAGAATAAWFAAVKNKLTGAEDKGDLGPQSGAESDGDETLGEEDLVDLPVVRTARINEWRRVLEADIDEVPDPEAGQDPDELERIVDDLEDELESDFTEDFSDEADFDIEIADSEPPAVIAELEDETEDSGPEEAVVGPVAVEEIPPPEAEGISQWLDALMDGESASPKSTFREKLPPLREPDEDDDSNS